MVEEQGVIDNLEPDVRDSSDVPSYTPELGRRLSEVIEKLGGLKNAAAHAGATDESLARWRDGRARPNFFGMQGLANAAGVSLDWLAHGVDPKSQTAMSGELVSWDAMADIIELVAQHLNDRGRRLQPQKYPTVCKFVYDELRQGKSIDAAVEKLVNMVSE